MPAKGKSVSCAFFGQAKFVKRPAGANPPLWYEPGKSSKGMGGYSHAGIRPERTLGRMTTWNRR